MTDFIDINPGWVFVRKWENHEENKRFWYIGIKLDRYNLPKEYQDSVSGTDCLRIPPTLNDKGKSDYSIYALSNDGFNTRIVHASDGIDYIFDKVNTHEKVDVVALERLDSILSNLRRWVKEKE